MSFLRTTHALSGSIVILVVAIALIFNSALELYSKMSNGNRMAASTIPYSRTTDSDAKVLIIGDSLAYGVGASSPETSFAGNISNQYPNATIINNAVIGHAIQSLAHTIDEELAGESYDAIFMIIGGNDIVRYGIDLQDSQNKLSQIYTKLSEHSERVFTYTTGDFHHVSITPSITKSLVNSRARQLRNYSIELADAHTNITYVDAFSIPASEYESLEADDGFHLNDKGIARLIELTFNKK